MSKRIAFCADGTWDNTTNNTNVYRIFKAMTTSADQVPYYDDGDGADGDPAGKLLGGAFGADIFQKIKDGYTKIAHAYEADDDLFIFGFSRGAYTARSLAGMIAVCGLPTANFTDDVVDTAFNAYRNKEQRSALLAGLNAKCDMYDAKIRMVGVWDTVGALGIPSLLGLVDPLLFGFLDTSLHPDVLNAYHAVAVDERRLEFPPTLWTGAPAAGQKMEQVWFSGVHSDVGGSYPLDADGTCLADLTLAWMMSKASALGLSFDAGVLGKYMLPMDAKIALDTKHESWNLGWTVPKERTVPAGSVLADSVSVRIGNDPQYRPSNIAIQNDVVRFDYQRAYVVTPAASAANQTTGR